MRKIREVLRLHSALSCTHRQIASACHISPSTVGAYIERAVEAGLTWAEAVDGSPDPRNSGAERA